MEPDYLGYVLNALDAPAQAEVEAHLRRHPEDQARVETLRQSLEPLAWDVDSSSPPPDLANRTLAYVEASAKGTVTARSATKRLGIHGMPWRRILEVAASLLMAVTAVGLGVSWLGGIRGQRPGGEPNPVELVACKENLRKVFVALTAFGETHNRQLPKVNTGNEPKRNAGGTVFTVLQDNNLLPADVQLVCPTAAHNCYAYSLGYRQGDKLIGPHIEDGKPISLMPLMADSSPPDPLQGGHSLSHGGSGQNVLFCDGHVAYCESRFVGYNQDDIYLNRDKKVAAGVDWSDAVLTSGTVPP